MSVTQLINGSLNITGSYLQNGVPYGGLGVTGPTGATSLGIANFDAFERLRVSNPFTLFDSSMIYKDNGKFDTYYTGANSTGTFNTNQSTMELSVGTAVDSQVLRQTYRVFPYQPGKSLMIMATFVMNPAKTNLTQRVGYFDSQNGVFFELADTTLNFVIRSFTTGVVTETRVPQTSWNVDTLQGAGPSGITLDITKAQILVIDLEWLGVGTVRVGFMYQDRLCYTHYFNHANVATSVYMTTACLPVRYQIINTGVTASSSTLKQICSTVISEGGYQATSVHNNKGTGITPAIVAVSPTITPIISIRLKAGRSSAIVLPTELEVLVTTVDTIQWLVIVNGTLNTSSFTSYSASSNVEYDTTATTITGGIIIQEGFATSTSTAKFSTSITDPSAFNYQLGVSIAGVSDVVTLAAINQTGTADVLGFLGWYELN